MALNYNKLWKLLIDKGIKKSDLERLTGLSHSTMSKLTNGQNVNTNVLDRICMTLECDIKDIVECVKENKNDNY